METIVQDEIQELIERFKETAGIPISTTNKFNAAVVNALWTIINGERFKQDDPNLTKIISLVTTNVADSNPIAMISLFLPWLSGTFPDLSGYKQFIGVIITLQEFIQPYIDHHMKTHEVGHPRDFIDTYIDEMKQTEDPNSSFHKEQRYSLLTILVDLFIAGAESTSTTLTWIFLYLARNQHVQQKLAIEIDKVVGNSRLPSLTDRPEMPYTEAVIHEVMRKTTLVPLGIMHGPAEDLEFHGYNIPKGTMVMGNLYEAQNSIELWGDPENFRPERFLSKDETKFERREGFCTFSVGKRQCLGETLARDELFLFTTALFQVFHVDIDRTAPPPSLEPHVGGVSSTKPHQLALTVRQ